MLKSNLLLADVEVFWRLETPLRVSALDKTRAGWPLLLISPSAKFSCLEVRVVVTLEWRFADKVASSSIHSTVVTVSCIADKTQFVISFTSELRADCARMC